MKKLLILALVVFAGTYGVGFIALREGSVNAYLDKMYELTRAGNADGLCKLLSNDMTVAIVDHTVELDPRLGDGKLTGGKTELCAHFKASVLPMAASGASLQVQRQDLRVKRQWLHPWTADVTYNEKQELTMQAGGRTLTIKTESDDKLLLVMTLRGVRMQRLESEAWLQ